MGVTVEQVLADAYEEVRTVRHWVPQAERFLAVLDAIAAALPEYCTWLTEAEAADYTGRSIPWLRARFAGWVKRGLAEQVGPQRRYRRAALEFRGNPLAAREAGKRAYRKAS